MKALPAVVLLCAAAMLVAANNWLPSVLSAYLGSAALVVAVLCSASAGLRLATQRKQHALGFFLVGLFLLVVACPAYRPAAGWFQTAHPQHYPEVAGEVVFIALGLVSVLRAWWLWTADKQ